jgi:hypothetical protein
MLFRGVGRGNGQGNAPVNPWFKPKTVDPFSKQGITDTLKNHFAGRNTVHFKRIVGQGKFGVTALLEDTRQNPPKRFIIKRALGAGAVADLRKEIGALRVSKEGKEEEPERSRDVTEGRSKNVWLTKITFARLELPRVGAHHPDGGLPGPRQLGGQSDSKPAWGTGRTLHRHRVLGERVALGPSAAGHPGPSTGAEPGALVHYAMPYVDASHIPLKNCSPITNIIQSLEPASASRGPREAAKARLRSSRRSRQVEHPSPGPITICI